MKKLVLLFALIFLGSSVEADNKKPNTKSENLAQATKPSGLADHKREAAINKRKEKINRIIEAIKTLEVGEVKSRVESLCQGSLDRQSKEQVLEKLHKVAIDHIHEMRNRASEGLKMVNVTPKLSD